MAELLIKAQRFYDGFNSNDFAAIGEVFDPGVETTEPLIGTLIGFEQWRANAEIFKRAMPDARLNILTSIEAEGTVVIEGAFTGTHTGPMATPQGDVPPSGRSINCPYADVLIFRDGKVVRHRTYYDQMTLLGQLGLIPAAGQ